MTPKQRAEEIAKARHYLSRCADHVTAAMHSSDETLKAASRELRQAQIRLAKLEGSNEPR